MSKVLVEINEDSLNESLKYFGIDSTFKKGKNIPTTPKDNLVKTKNPFIDDSEDDKIEDKTLEKGLKNSISNDDNQIGADYLNTLSKATEILKSFGEMQITIKKAMEQNLELQRKNVELGKELGKAKLDLKKALNKFSDFESRLKAQEQLPIGNRRSITKGFIPNKEEGKNNLNEKTYSLSRNKQIISDILLEKSNIPAIERGDKVSINTRFSKAVESLTYNNLLPSDIIEELKKEGINIVN